ncbi:hypothetical protein N5J06_03845 [Ralstonia sp. CHL-2022]|uniref:Uncharacterized protein n=1 Tax=Ralstonia mojiangensis TaxID=2953895 RepID=A0ABT2L4E2_9RALS|nr:hypothetical protein [Ralstonia mojiangensis]MCT7310063.1 hypothetical protein [Ralstonia mojiangensis]
MTEKFDPDKLKTNALTSIRLGVEDFTRSQLTEDGDADRALSALRNLFAGILLLFKYRIATKAGSPADGYELIFKTGEILPQPDGMGGIEWQPTKFAKTTIDVPDIRKRFDAFGIQTDWKVIETLQKERNSAEHLHPQNAAGVIGKFLSDTFPVLSEFIQKELECAPATLLGETWKTMLAHHDFYKAQAAACESAWEVLNVPDDLLPVVPDMQCEECGSSLLKPAGGEDESSDLESGQVKYVCVSCAHRALAIPLLEETLVDFLGGYDPYSGEEPPTGECPECQHRTFVHVQGECLWCGMKLNPEGCARCGNSLTLDDYDNMLCGYCQYQADKHRDD